MDGRRRNELHPIGYSGAKGEYRVGVHAGNYAEEILAADARGRPGFLLDKGGSFAASTTTREAFTADGKTGKALAANTRRDDIFLKYVKYGRSQVMGEDRSGFWASTTQLAYDGASGAAAVPNGASSQASGAPCRVQDCLWGVDKAHNRRVPVTVQAYSASTERARKLAEEAAASPYRTVEQDTLAAAAADAAARAAAKPPQARPRDEQGQDTQVGRKAAGEFTGMLDNDWVRIGLRKP